MAEIPLNLLEVDLTNGTSKVVDVTEDAKIHFFGNGLGLKLLWDNVPAGTDPLSPDNILHIGVGPPTGLIGCKVSHTFLSPLSGWAGESSLSGNIGEEIVNAQYNAGILLKGKAPQPSYLMVYDDKVEVRPAGDLWGMWRGPAEYTLQDRLNKETGEQFACLTIGPAGENLVRYANTTTQFIHSSSKDGVGAVYGSKNIKSVAVRGTKGRLCADPEETWSLYMGYFNSPGTPMRRTGESRWAHFRSYTGCMRHIVDPVHNAHGSYADYKELIDNVSFLKNNLQHVAWETACPGCSACCFLPIFRMDERGYFCGEFRHGNTAGHGNNCDLDWETLSETSTLMDELGMEGETCGCLEAWAMDLYEHGLISLADLDGVDLKWGDLEATCEFMKKMAYREGRAADAMAEGFFKAVEILGPDTAWYGWFNNKGDGAPRYDLRHKQYGAGLSDGSSCGSGGSLRDAITICNFAVSPFSAIYGGNNGVAKVFLNAVCGWDISVDDVKMVDRRNSVLARLISLRHGFDITKDYWLPPRAFDEPITDKYGNTFVWDKADWEEQIKDRFVNTLGLDELGRPKKDEVESLGLGYVLPELEPMGVIG